mgnify:CR=1 FL=1
MRTIETLSSSRSTLVRLCYSIGPSLKIRKGHPLHVADQHAIADDPGLYQFYA